jgi:hypothetical protein
VREQDTLLTPGGGRWKLNLVQGQPTQARLGGCDASLRPELVRDPLEVDRLLAVMSAKNPMVGRFVPTRKQPTTTTTRNGSAAPSSTASASSAGAPPTQPRGKPSTAKRPLLGQGVLQRAQTYARGVEGLLAAPRCEAGNVEPGRALALAVAQGGTVRPPSNCDRDM